MGAILTFITMDVFACSASMGATIAVGTWIKAANKHSFSGKSCLGSLRALTWSVA